MKFLKHIAFILSAGYCIALCLLAGCTKPDTKPAETFGIRVLNDTSENAFGGIASDKQGYIYLMVNQQTFIQDSSIIMKIDPKGNLQWRKAFCFDKNTTGLTVLDAGDGLIIPFNVEGGRATHTVKFDYEGKIIWQTSVPIINYSMNIAIGPDHSLMVIGMNDSSNVAAAARLNGSTGKIQWLKEYGLTKSFNGDLSCCSGAYTADGGFVFGGTRAFGLNNSTEATIHKVDAEGRTVWADSLGISAFGKDSPAIWPMGVVEAADGQIYVAYGRLINIAMGGYEIFIVKPDPTGAQPTITNIGLRYSLVQSGNANAAFYMGRMTDGNLYIAGQADKVGVTRHQNLFISKFDASFNKSFIKTYGGYHDLVGCMITPYKNGGFLLGTSTTAFGNGKNKSDIEIIITDADGNIVQ